MGSTGRTSTSAFISVTARAAPGLAQRVARDERLELARQPAVATEREVGGDAVLDAGEGRLLQAPGGGRGERLGELRQRRPAPERERGREGVGRAAGVAGGERAAALGRQQLEAREVQRAGRQRELVAGRPRAQRRRPAGPCAAGRPGSAPSWPPSPGGSSPQRSSIRLPTATVRPASSRRRARRARARPPPRGTARVPSHTSSGPRMQNRTTRANATSGRLPVADPQRV